MDVAIAAMLPEDWGALAPVSSRCVYGGVAEVSVYPPSRAMRRASTGR